MDKPDSKTLAQISDCLDRLVRLRQACRETQLPEELRLHGESILTTLFKPRYISGDFIEDLNEQLHIINEILQKKEVIIALAEWMRVTGKDPAILRVTEKSTILSKHYEIKDDGIPVSPKPVSAGVIKPPPNREIYLDKRDQLSIYERTDSISYSNIKSKNYNRPGGGTGYIEGLTNQEMRSQRDEKRMDGSPSSHESRENGRFGSHPPYDNFREESHS